MVKVWKYLRGAEWYDSKIPFMLATMLYLFVVGKAGESIFHFYAGFFAYAWYLCMFLAFSYVINDYSDLEVDKLAGKKKIMADLSHGVIRFSLVAMVLVGVLPGLFVTQKKLLYVLLSILVYFGGAAYSIKAFRFKEKGAIGLVECSFVQRSLPLFLIPCFLQVDIWYLLLFVLISFLNGLRYILVHQTMDLENDQKSGVKTFVSTGHSAYRICIYVCFGLECVLMLFVLLRLATMWKLSFLFIPLYIVFERIVSIVVKRFAQAEWFVSYVAMPLEDLYHGFFPVLMGLGVFALAPVYWGVFLLVLVFCTRMIYMKCKLVKVYFCDK